MIPTGALGRRSLVRACVPMDDEHTMFWSIGVPRSQRRRNGDGRRCTGSTPAAGRRGGRRTPAASSTCPTPRDWLGSFRLTQTADNDYLIDREAQRTDESYTGIPGIRQQDLAVTESMGPIYDRTQRAPRHHGRDDHPHAPPHDQRARRRCATHGDVPPGVDNPEVYRQRSGGVILPRSADWLEATKDLRTVAP